ncbi:MAG TPA: NYN domain-containing protein [Pirellulales bacterium]|nr:NYN domain-containing protein [Pirellulales bacterium]
MSLIIDGYNLMHAAGIVGRGAGPGFLERSRLAVLNFVVESLEPRVLATTTVVFDARQAPPGLPRELVHRGVKVHFASGYDSADELIEELIGRNSSPRRLTVVSSDHRLHRAARRRKAQAIDSDRWYEQTLAERSKRQRAAKTKTPKPPTPLATSEVEYWLAQFGDEPKAQPRPPRGADGNDSSAEKSLDPSIEIFPQEYLDSIDENDLGK